jgi:hypothetical protein
MSAAATLVQPSISEEDLKALAEDVAAFVNRKIEGLATADDLQFLATEVKKAIDKRISGIPALVPDINVAPSAANIDVHVPQQQPPVINVATSPAAVEVNIPQQPAPIVNVETTPAIVNVAPAAPAPATVNVDLAPIAAALQQMQKQHAAQCAMDDARLASIESTLAELVRLGAAPKDLVFDKDGKPTGIKTRGA